MKAFRIILALLVAGATFYSLNTLAVQRGYPDRLDLRNRNHCVQDCRNEQLRNHSFSHHDQKTADTLNTSIDSLKR